MPKFKQALQVLNNYFEMHQFQEYLETGKNVIEYISKNNAKQIREELLAPAAIYLAMDLHFHFSEAEGDLEILKSHFNLNDELFSEVLEFCEFKIDQEKISHIKGVDQDLMHMMDEINQDDLQVQEENEIKKIQNKRAQLRKSIQGLELYVQLMNVEPIIWRTFNISKDTTFDTLHMILQIVMGWSNSHLHEFLIEDGKNQNLKPLKEALFENEEKFLVVDFLNKPNDQLIYRYDLGDQWDHKIVCNKVFVSQNQSSTPSFKVNDGANNCPIENCGGPLSYQKILKKHKNKIKANNKKPLDLPKNFDPKQFSIDLANENLGMFLNEENSSENFF